MKIKATLQLEKIAFGGGCHWCTEAVFQSLIGVHDVAQGWVQSTEVNNTFSEAVIVAFDANVIPLKILTEIHLRTHKSTVQHSMRKKYRSAVYFFEDIQEEIIEDILSELQDGFDSTIITQILPFVAFKPSQNDFTNYYYSKPTKPFCEQYINPKLKLLLRDFSSFADTGKLKGLE
ncbi:peptide-methionine (S)-S-oxide reductase [Kordia sp. YSTF-M3]|uniref:peptide-methionine (S)-S-oxide reductase n=1 Tax=Kordia aestuariivivens TaxID=2759037 RepID=A0ABR7QDT0_9FLAO|nr:peptide-methionine (S)-S-oxide reductase [Kordia aestuariivivens]MBC8756578.1 peptide-methionine (S)-S-oxide reductase [Kordia aestuariivivens]